MSRATDLSQLEEGWDGVGSKPIHPRAIAAYVALSAEFDGRLPAELEPMANHNGGLRMEWDRGPISYVAELDPDGSLFVCSLAVDENADQERTYLIAEARTLKRFYDTGRIEATE